MPAKSGDLGPTAAAIVDLLGEAGTIALAENFGGTRLYVPATHRPNSELVAAIGIEAAQKLSSRFSPDVIRVPLMREMRAAHYRSQGLSNAKIAVRLGIVETSVNRIFLRLGSRQEL